ncbi:class I SAM-dependent methyltransferase [Pseudonocardia sp. RS010]|uniref:class I SAM-dependent methyltransferase n=1 Tax=Pseudonocardia sp. RS010 TaxID=3385979 RepID=UPI0039A01259
MTRSRPDEPEQRPGLAERAFAAAYDPLTALAERRVLGRVRRRLITPLSGRVVEIGAGTGANLAYYGSHVDLTVCEPALPMRRRLERAVSDRPATTVSSAPAEDLPVADATVDALVCTLVLCTVSEPHRALAEARRALRPGGVLVLLEHVRGRPGLHARVQDLVAPVWRTLACGCRPNQDTAALLEDAGFAWVDRDRHDLPVPVVSPLVAGLLIPR